jgi:hypothetical protein
LLRDEKSTGGLRIPQLITSAWTLILDREDQNKKKILHTVKIPVSVTSNFVYSECNFKQQQQNYENDSETKNKPELTLLRTSSLSNEIEKIASKSCETGP